MRKLKQLLLITLISLGLTVSTNASEKLDVVTYPSSAADDPRYSDNIEILYHSLEVTSKTYGDYVMKPSEPLLSEDAYLASLKAGRHVNVVWSSTNDKKERELQPIRIPLKKGLLSYRISITHKEQQPQEVDSLEDLSQFSFIQGIGWGDTAVYRHNGLDVTELPYAKLFEAINLQRFELFPRGIGEVRKELDAFSDEYPNLTYNDTFIIHYPWPYYFFLNKQDERLYQRILEGLTLLVNTGKLDEIVMKYHGEDIKWANLNSKPIIYLENPMLPPETPLDNEKLWFQPASAD